MTENKKLLLTLKINSFDVESWYEASDLPDVFKAYEFSNIKDAKDFFERDFKRFYDSTAGTETNERILKEDSYWVCDDDYWSGGAKLFDTEHGIYCVTYRMDSDSYGFTSSFDIALASEGDTNKILDKNGDVTFKAVVEPKFMSPEDLLAYKKRNPLPDLDSGEQVDQELVSAIESSANEFFLKRENTSGDSLVCLLRNINYFRKKFGDEECFKLIDVASDSFSNTLYKLPNDLIENYITARDTFNDEWIVILLNGWNYNEVEFIKYAEMLLRKGNDIKSTQLYKNFIQNTDRYICLWVKDDYGYCLSALLRLCQEYGFENEKRQVIKAIRDWCEKYADYLDGFDLDAYLENNGIPHEEEWDEEQADQEIGHDFESSADEALKTLAEGYEMVDLGLPSGLKWAKCNIGADKETDYGMYFKFGDVVGHGAQDCSHDNSVPTVEVDGNNHLLPAYDAATQLMGEGYRMPTKEECEELINNTDYAFMTIDGVSGMRYSKRGDANTYIFIPFAGLRFSGAGRYGYLWSSTLIDDFIAFKLYCSYHGYTYTNNDFRCYGFSVRGVSE